MTFDDKPPSRRPISLAAFLTARLLNLRPRHGPRPHGQTVRDGLEAPRWAVTVGVLLFALLFLALLVLLLVPASAMASSSQGINFDRPTKDWYQGPVRYIITKQEVKAYKALETEAERATFIDWFWQRRNPDSASPIANSFREQFEKRVFEATRKFSATTIPGWKTDMGKIYILVGPPEEEINDPMPSSGRGTVTWVYRRPPFPDLPPNTVIAFARDVGGEWRLSVNPTIDSDVARGLKTSRVKVTYDGTVLRDGQVDPILLAAGASLSQNEIQTRIIYNRMQQLPPDEEAILKTSVITKETYGQTIPLETRFDYFRGDDGTFTAVTVGVRSTSVQYKSVADKEVPDVAVFGKLVGRDDPTLTYPLASDSTFAPSMENGAAGVGDELIFQAVGAFKPGVYRAVLGVEDRVSHRVSSMSRDVTIPDLSGGDLALSSLTLASALDPGDYATSVAKPFQIGKFHIVPRPNSTFARDEELNVYFQIYNPASDPAAAKPRLDVFYSFRVKLEDGSAKDLGTYRVQDSYAQVQGYAVPLKQWPIGNYDVTVTVNDKVAQKTVNATTQFSIRE